MLLGWLAVCCQQFDQLREEMSRCSSFIPGANHPKAADDQTTAARGILNIQPRPTLRGLAKFGGQQFTARSECKAAGHNVVPARPMVRIESRIECRNRIAATKRHAAR